MWVSYILVGCMGLLTVIGDYWQLLQGLRATSQTRLKAHDHEVVRAQKKVSKCRPNTPPNIM